MTTETLENGDYITLEEDDMWGPPYYYKEIYTRYDKNDNFIYSLWEYIQC